MEIGINQSLPSIPQSFGDWQGRDLSNIKPWNFCILIPFRFRIEYWKLNSDECQNNETPSVSYLLKVSSFGGDRGQGRRTFSKPKISARLTKFVPTEFSQNKPLNKCVQIKFTNVPIPHKHFASFWYLVVLCCNLRVQPINKLGPIMVRTVVN